MSMCVGVEARGICQVPCSITLSTLHFEIGFLIVPGTDDWARLAGHKTLGYVFAALVLGLQACTVPPGSYVVAGNLTLGPHACALPLELTPQHLLNFSVTASCVSAPQLGVSECPMQRSLQYKSD